MGRRGRQWGCWLLAAVTLLLPGLVLAICACEEGRILTRMPPGEHVPYVELTNGHLDFFEEQALTNLRNRENCAPYSDYMAYRTYQEIVEEIDFDPGAATAGLPEHLQLGEESYDVKANAARFEPEEDRPNGVIKGGLIFRLADWTRWTTDNLPSLQLIVCPIEDIDIMLHLGYLSYCVYPWERENEKKDQQLPPEALAYRPSEVRGITVGALHLIAPGEEEGETVAYYYAGFYAGDLAFALQMRNGYATQEEYVQVLMALINGVYAQGLE